MERTTAWVVLTLGALLMTGALVGAVIALVDGERVTTLPQLLLLVLVAVGMWRAWPKATGTADGQRSTGRR